MMQWIIAALAASGVAIGIIGFQSHRISTLDAQVTTSATQIKGLTVQRDLDQINLDTAMKQVRQAQNERNQIARQLAQIKDQQSLDWLHANIPDGVRGVLSDSTTTTKN